MNACRNATNSSSSMMPSAIRIGAGAMNAAAEGEDQADEREQHDVPGRHVGEQTDRERERLRELSDDLDRRHDRRSCNSFMTSDMSLGQ